MGERKVLNKYIPADFDPSLVPKGKKLSQKDGTVPVRMMLPFSVQCSTCNTFLYRGRKFNSKKEPMGGSQGRYLGIQRWRFYIKCTHCSRPITFLTDPQNADYEMESGGTRNYEVYKDKKQTEEAAVQEKEEEEKIDPMKALENRVLDSQREMADLDNLEEIKAMNRRHISLLSSSGEDFNSGAKQLLDKIEAQRQGHNTEEPEKESELNDEDEALIKSIKFGQAQRQNENTKKIKRLDEGDERRLEEQRQHEIALLEQKQKEISQKASGKEKKSSFAIIKVKRKRLTTAMSNNEESKKSKVKEEGRGGGLVGLLGDYGSDSDSD